MAAKLYEIVNEIMQLVDQVDEHGEMAAGTEDRIDELQLALTVKADNVARFIRQCDADGAAYGSEASRLAMLQKQMANKADRLKRYLKSQLERAGLTNLKTELFNLTVCNNSVPTVKLEEGRPVPDDFAKTITTISLDTAKVLEAHKAGELLPPGVSVMRGTHLRIR